MHDPRSISIDIITTVGHIIRSEIKKLFFVQKRLGFHNEIGLSEKIAQLFAVTTYDIIASTRICYKICAQRVYYYNMRTHARSRTIDAFPKINLANLIKTRLISKRQWDNTMSRSYDRH